MDAQQQVNSLIADIERQLRQVEAASDYTCIAYFREPAHAESDRLRIVKLKVLRNPDCVHAIYLHPPELRHAEVLHFNAGTGRPRLPPFRIEAVLEDARRELRGIRDGVSELSVTSTQGTCSDKLGRHSIRCVVVKYRTKSTHYVQSVRVYSYDGVCLPMLVSFSRVDDRTETVTSEHMFVNLETNVGLAESDFMPAIHRNKPQAEEHEARGNRQ